VLVATTVIEVGIDVANASVIAIEGAERYGVSQLHQLRGRVGRGAHDSHCLLFPEDGGELARRRLRAVERERDGFKLAEVDLALRGEGEVLGTRQSGLPRFAAAELPEDTPLLIGMTVEVNVVTSTREDALLVPVGALAVDGSVFVVEDGRAQRRAVATGIRGTTMVEIVEGLRDGEPVVAPVPYGLEDGTRVLVEPAL
jgi:hypothetical protein